MRSFANQPSTLSRRDCLHALGAGFGSLALADLLHAEEARQTVGRATTHFAPRARHVIFLFMNGGPSHIDLFDPKPLIAKFEGQRPESVNLRTERVTKGLMPAPSTFRPGGQSGVEVSDLMPQVRDCVDDICIVRSVYGPNPNHAPAANFLVSGHIDQTHPSLGAWLSYGLGSENESLPGLVALQQGAAALRFVRNGYLPGQHQGTPIDLSEKNPERMIRYLQNSKLDLAQQRRQLEFIQRQNQTHLDDRPDDPVLEARIRAMETAFRMQFAAGEAVDLRLESAAVREEYGEGEFASGCLLARRLVERGVRYVHLNSGGWDHHENINRDLAKRCGETDRPIAALLRDLKRRGLLDETLVIWGGEFGRTPVSENGNGRDHNPFGFTVWLAGGGVRGGQAYGATDDFGFRAVENRVSVHDLHATILHLMGLDHEKLTYRYSGRDFRLTDVHGHVVSEIIA